MKRVGQLIGVKPDQVDAYVEAHAAVWPGVLATIHECNIRNYSIFLIDNRLFAYFEYVGDDFDADMDKMAADQLTQEWWDFVKPMQEPVDPGGDWWLPLKEVFHID